MYVETELHEPRAKALEIQEEIHVPSSSTVVRTELRDVFRVLVIKTSSFVALHDHARPENAESPVYNGKRIADLTDRCLSSVLPHLSVTGWTIIVHMLKLFEQLSLAGLR